MALARQSIPHPGPPPEPETIDPSVAQVCRLHRERGTILEAVGAFHEQPPVLMRLHEAEANLGATWPHGLQWASNDDQMISAWARRLRQPAAGAGNDDRCDPAHGALGFEANAGLDEGSTVRCPGD